MTDLDGNRMDATAPQFDEDLAEHAPTISRLEAQREDAYWRRTYWQQRYYEIGFEYEDYAPAYCVGYVGYAQYGGEFEQAERSLHANWERVKSDSRLGLADAMAAMRAAWDRMARVRHQPRLTVIEGGLARRAPHRAPLEPDPAAVAGAAAAVAP